MTRASASDSSSDRDLIAGYSGEDSDPELTRDMATAFGCSWESVASNVTYGSGIPLPIAEEQ